MLPYCANFVGWELQERVESAPQCRLDFWVLFLRHFERGAVTVIGLRVGTESSGPTPRRPQASHVWLALKVAGWTIRQ